MWLIGIVLVSVLWFSQIKFKQNRLNRIVNTNFANIWSNHNILESANFFTSFKDHCNLLSYIWCSPAADAAMDHFRIGRVGSHRVFQLSLGFGKIGCCSALGGCFVILDLIPVRNARYDENSSYREKGARRAINQSRLTHRPTSLTHGSSRFTRDAINVDDRTQSKNNLNINLSRRYVKGTCSLLFY